MSTRTPLNGSVAIHDSCGTLTVLAASGDGRLDVFTAIRDIRIWGCMGARAVGATSPLPRANACRALGRDHYARLAAVARLMQVLAGGRPIAKAPESKRQHLDDAALLREARLLLSE